MATLGSLPTGPFEDLIRDLGERPTFWMQRVGPCPNTHESATAGFSPDTTCALCGGTGTVYRSMSIPTTGKTGGKVLATEFGYGDYQAPIELQTGDLFAAWIESEFPLADGDRLGLPSRQADHGETFLVSATGSNALRFTPALSVSAVYAPTGVVSASAYSLASDGKTIVWAGGAPAAGTQVLVRYRWRPTWIVAANSLQKLPQASNGDFFPTLGVLRLFGQSPVDRKAGDS